MNLSDRISSDDMQRVNDMRNHPDFEPGFEGGDDSLFSSGDDADDLESLFGSSRDDSFGGGDSFGSSDGFSDGFGSSDNSFGSAGNGFGSTSSGSGFGNTSGFGVNGGGSSFGPTSPFQTNTQQDGNGTLDKMTEYGIDTARTIGEILIELCKSIKLRNADDIGYLNRNLLIGGLAMIPISIVLGLICGALGVESLSLSGFSLQLLLCGSLMLGSGAMGMGTAALVLAKIGRREEDGVSNIPDVQDDNNFTDEYEDNLGDELDDLFNDDIDSLFGDEEQMDNSTEQDNPFSNNSTEDYDDSFAIEDEEDNEPMDLDSALNNVMSNSVVNRQKLFNTFKPMLPKETPDFKDFNMLDTDSSDFQALETIGIKCLANIGNIQLEEVNSSLESAKETKFVYELKLRRINRVKKTDELAREIETYMREDSEDDNVNATVAMEGDFYKIVVTKGVNAIITFGDIFQDQNICDFYLNAKNKLPMITGIDELGNVIAEDAKNFDTMLIAGKPRSGKSWYLLSILMSMMLFNTPEDVQFCIIDPKESNLFKTIALMPHVCGLHNDENILEILDDIINVEAPRRKKLLASNRCDDIWALRKKGIMLPVLYVVIDEYMTVVGNLDSDGKKDLNSKLQVLISQLPSQGIRLIFIPHRATGIVDKTNRTMIQFASAVRANNDDVVDTLGIKKWDRALTKPGDIAIKSSTMKSAKYVKGAALTTDDGDNTIFIETAAKAFYKMGVEIPDMSNMRIATNRDDDYIREQLYGDSNITQFSAEDLDNVDDIDMDAIING
jgi:hypothetical protein